MEVQEFKPENVGETRLVITKGQFKGYTILIRTAVTNVLFEGNYAPNETPIFTVTHHDSFIVVPPPQDIRKDMK